MIYAGCEQIWTYWRRDFSSIKNSLAFIYNLIFHTSTHQHATQHCATRLTQHTRRTTRTATQRTYTYTRHPPTQMRILRKHIRHTHAIRTRPVTHSLSMHRHTNFAPYCSTHFADTTSAVQRVMRNISKNGCIRNQTFSSVSGSNQHRGRYTRGLHPHATPCSHTASLTTATRLQHAFHAVKI